MSASAGFTLFAKSAALTVPVDVHVIDARCVKEKMIVERGDVEAIREQRGHQPDSPRLLSRSEIAHTSRPYTPLPFVRAIHKPPNPNGVGVRNTRRTNNV
jgi:hypothetical protein